MIKYGNHNRYPQGISEKERKLLNREDKWALPRGAVLFFVFALWWLFSASFADWLFKAGYINK
jgi:hypothetical protein